MTPTTQPGGQQSNILETIINFVKNNQTLQHLLSGQGGVSQSTPGIAPTPNGQGIGGFLGLSPGGMTPAQNPDQLQKAVNSYMDNLKKSSKKGKGQASNPQAILAKATEE